jgi:hypothetical protein
MLDPVSLLDGKRESLWHQTDLYALKLRLFDESDNYVP